jgi:hypothetical protein
MNHAVTIQQEAGENVVVVMPKDDVSSYTLADIASAGVVYASTLGLEMACTGLSVVVTAQATWAHTGFAERVADPQDFGPAIGRALEQGRQPEIARTAIRWAVHFFKHWAMPFSLVIEEPPHSGQVTWGCEDELAPGRDATLDRICHTVLEGGSVYRKPTKGDYARSTEAEDEWLRMQFEPAATVELHDPAINEPAINEPAINELSVDDLVRQGEHFFSTGEHAEALRCFLDACELDPEHADSWNNLGVLLHLTGETEAGLRALERSIAVDANDANRVVNLARVLASLGRREEAVKWTTDAVARMPDQPEGWAFLQELAESA